MGDLLLGMVTWMLMGYLAGLTIGFAAFDPNTDVYALMGAAFAIVGLLLGLTPYLRRYTHIALGGLIGFYLGAILGILLLGSPASDDLLEVARSSKLIVSLIGAGVGVFLGYRFGSGTNRLGIAAFLFGGFFGGLLLSAAGIAPRLGMVAVAPYFIVCGLLCAFVVVWVQRHRKRTTAA